SDVAQNSRRSTDESTNRLVLPPIEGVSESRGQASSAFRILSPSSSSKFGKRHSQISLNTVASNPKPNCASSLNISVRSLQSGVGRKYLSCRSGPKSFNFSRNG